MKKIAKQLLNNLFGIILLFSLPAFSQTKADKIALAISNGTVIINGTTFNSFDAFTMDAVTKLLGKPDRAKNGYNKLHTYDNLGVVFLKTLPTGV
ncbi:MAG: hypothetical protein M0D57_09015 [Sphingobacteriales bacterium JAD_PAG50586_3]|nr:MAG: hypothetical protein M0D57_09015 [Sphingobacteriales bacterium JAD_PAG50586_3]